MADIEHNTLTDAQLHVVGYVQSGDPGAVGVGKVWVDTTGGVGAWVIKIRNAADNGWEEAIPGDHKNLHDPEDGGDALDTAAPSELGGVQASGVGSSHSFARADHAHQIQHAVTDNHLVTVDDASISTGHVGFWTANGMEGKSSAEAKVALAYLTDLSDDTTPTAGGDLDVNNKDLHNIKQADFDLYDAGTSGTAKTINWNNGNKQKLQVTGNACDLSYTDPVGACSLTLYLIGNGTLYTNIDADHDSDCEWADDAEPAAYGSTSGQVIGILFYEFESSLTPKYVVAGSSVGVA